MPDLPPRPQQSFPPPRRKRRISAWSILAPIALIVLIVLIVKAVEASCLHNCSSKSSTTSTHNSAAANDSTTAHGNSTSSTTASPPAHPPKHYVVRSGDTASAIATKFGLSTTQLAACNPQLSDLRSLSVGTYLNVGTKCQKQATDSQT